MDHPTAPLCPALGRVTDRIGPGPLDRSALRGESARPFRTGRSRGGGWPLPGGVHAWFRCCAALAMASAAGITAAAQMVIPGPAGSSRFGTAVAVLPNGDFVVADPEAPGPGGIAQAGAVYHYRPNGSLVATLRGASANDQVGGSSLVGTNGILVLANGNYLVRSPRWDNGSTVDAGAVTFVRGDTGLDGVVSASNSLVGSSADDLVGFLRPIALANGNYLVLASDWNNGAAIDAGAVVFGNGTTGISGPITASNAVVGASANDRVGAFGSVDLLTNGNWVARHPQFDAGAIVDAGAVTFGSAATGRFGVVSAANSLVGTSTNDAVGSSRVVPLANGNYVFAVPAWNNGAVVDAGAVVFGSGTSGVAGLLTTDKALFGSSANDRVGSSGITPLPNGAYLVASPNWRNGSATNAGAVTFGNGSTGIVGAVSATNSLVGVQSGDGVGSRAPVVLANGNWVIGSPLWNNGGLADVGAVTFGFGTTGRTGAVTSGISLVGATAGDQVGEQIVALRGPTDASIGRYVVVSPLWNGSGVAVDAGAVTMLNGNGGVSGTVLAINSLVGSQIGDRVGGGGVFALADGRYVVASPLWDNGATIDVGAVTLRNANLLEAGAVSTSNSLIGAAAGDEVGGGGVVPLPNSAYLVLSPDFSIGPATGAGAVTWAPPATGRVATVSAANSLVGSRLLDSIGGGGSSALTLLDDGDAVLTSPFWDDGVGTDVGAATYIDCDSGRTGPVGALNSLVGSASNDSVGSNGVIALPGGDYLVRSSGWRNGGAAGAGALSFGTDSGTSGAVSAANSVVGSTANDGVGSQVTVLPDGNFIVRSDNWDNAATVNAGAFTLGLSSGEVAGPLTDTHSVLGTVASGGIQNVVGYDPARRQMVVGQPLANRVVLHRAGQGINCGASTQTPNPSTVGASVTFSTFVSGTGANLYDGRMTVRASNGQQCVDTVGSTSSPNVRQYSCSIAFGQAGTFATFVEFTGSATIAYCAISTPLPQTVLDVVFRNGFE